jgi:4-diphosphocytidyl-2C-methyl-D-erythritol kinase
VPQDAPFNDLAEPACRVRPALGDLQRRTQAALGVPVHITGSGSTLFLIAPNVLAAKALARKVTATTGLAAVATRTLAPR